MTTTLAAPTTVSECPLCEHDEHTGPCGGEHPDGRTDLVCGCLPCERCHGYAVVEDQRGLDDACRDCGGTGAA